MPNILTSPRKFDKKALLAKLETTVGTDAVPTGAANWIEARNLTLTPYDGETVDRGIVLPYMGHAGKIVVANWCKVTFEVLAAGAGAAGSVPKVDALLKACGFAATTEAGVSVTYNLISEAIPAVSIYVNVDGTLHQMIGSRGTVGLTLNAKAIPVFKFEFDAVFMDPAAVAMPAVTRTGWPLEEPVNATNTSPLTINATAMAFSALDLSLATERARLNLPGPQTGVEINDRAPTGTATVLAPDLATFNPFTLAKTAADITLTVTHGSAAGKKLKVDAKAVLTGANYADVEKMVAYTLNFDLKPVAGNDELAFTFM